LDPAGKTVRGQLDVGSRGEAYRSLEEKRLTPLQVRSSDERELSPAKTRAAQGAVKLRSAQLILFTEELADLLDAGVQLQQALTIMAERQQDPAIKKVSRRIGENLRDGATFANGLRDVSPSFDELYRNLVAAGEASGSLTKILKRLGNSLTILHELQMRVVQAMIYPAFLIFACIGLIVVFMTVLVPQLTTLLTSTNQELPAATQMLINLSAGFAKHWWRLLVGLVGTVVLFQGIKAMPAGRLWWDFVKVKFPLFGPVLANRYFATLSQGLANLVGNGVPLLSALKLMTKATTNHYYRQQLQKATKAVEDGAAFSTALRQAKGFPLLLVDLTAVGEQTGHLGRSLEKAAIRYDKELNSRISRLTSMITPIIIVIMAVIVTLVAYSIVTAIFKSVNGIRANG
jgi:general secretion pathway protein F/type IV pilus assembly protein PilC